MAARQAGDVILDVRNISLRFGGVKALTDITFDVREHEIRAIIGPNGAGKSSMLNCINGVYQPQQGSIHLRGGPLERARVALGAGPGQRKQYTDANGWLSPGARDDAPELRELAVGRTPDCTPALADYTGLSMPQMRVDGLVAPGPFYLCLYAQKGDGTRVAAITNGSYHLDLDAGGT